MGFNTNPRNMIALKKITVILALTTVSVCTMFTWLNYGVRLGDIKEGGEEVIQPANYTRETEVIQVRHTREAFIPQVIGPLLAAIIPGGVLLNTPLPGRNQTDIERLVNLEQK